MEKWKLWYVKIFRQAIVSSKNNVGNITSKKSVKQKDRKQKPVNTANQKFANISQHIVHASIVSSVLIIKKQQKQAMKSLK